MSNSTEFVPIINMSPDDRADPRFQTICAQYQDTYLKAPSFFVRVPGRVNLIGEHIDYSGFAVLPMAMQQDILVAADINEEGKVNITNVDRTTYKDFSSDVESLPVGSPPVWHQYFLAGYLGVLENVTSDRSNGAFKRPGMDITMHGNLPPSAGLSSSSALVCAGALTAKFILEKMNPGLKISKADYAALSAKSERFIGTQGGGMDQAIAFMGEDGKAKLIEFFPSIQCTDVLLPKTATFHISHCGTAVNKASTHQYNTRVLETKLAAAMIAKQSAASVGGDAALKGLENGKFDLGTVQRALNKKLNEMPTLLKTVFQEDKLYNTREIIEALGINSEDELIKLISGDSTIASQKFSSIISNPDAKFPLYKRALHVYTEAQRVYQFKDICESGSSEEEKLARLGELMNDSHTSCRDLFECSCPELDALVELARNNGAKGARLTGAGNNY